MVVPYLYYEDVAAAVDWLTEAFGFRELKDQTIRGSEGQVLHTAMELGGGTVMMGRPSPEYQNPRSVGHVSGNLYVYVEDVEAHLRGAQEAGAEILSELEDTFYGDRRYGVEDPEGHQWYFAEKTEAVDPADWAPTSDDLDGHG